ncbi:unknown protein [Simkania negevensis Z]|uniref:Uncharacterized protein n=1 Tax=Simkania negevensis (strain ATCC VR-1471 / DSM 27360 / Z) TaxID=331113 RepID=F8L677_SIMNZ|nr:unknown protein [Simkania negevensis Z]
MWQYSAPEDLFAKDFEIERG